MVWETLPIAVLSVESGRGGAQQNALRSSLFALSYFPVQNSASREANSLYKRRFLESETASFVLLVPGWGGAHRTSYAGCETSQRPMLMRLSAMIPSPTHRFIPSAPW